ncbi:serine/threonine-protein kinase Sgk2 [Hypoxylon argillaceum]|nr:serine/threonine-protein kinase Sgk2 [Hypoxylon argillaceum]
MELSKGQISIIADNPLALDNLRDQLRNPSHMQDAIFNLLAQLGSSSAMQKLYPSSDLTMKRALPKMLLYVMEDKWKLEKFTPLINVIIGGLPDTDIWAAVLDLVNVIQKPNTPPANLPATNLEPPSETYTSWLDDNETVELIEHNLFFEIGSCVFREVDGFWEKYFDPDSCSRQQKAMYTGMFSKHNGNGWEFPKRPDEKSIWKWLVGLENLYLTGATNKLSNTTTPYQLKVKGQMDVYFRLRDPGSQYDYLVVGELKESPGSDKFKSNILQLARLVRGIFKEQPTRRFVHAFLLCGSKMELWVFDRSGLYSSGEFDIVSDPDKFARALVKYATMDDNALGRDVFVKDSHQVTLHDANSTTGGEITITLTAEPFVRRNAIVCRGTTCYKTEDDNTYVAKFAWAPAKRMSEIDLLKHAKDTKVQGVVKVVAYREITSIRDLRQGLDFPKRHHFRDTIADKDPHCNSSINNTSSHKRKSSNEGSSNMSSKRRRFSTGQPDPAQSSASYQTSLSSLETTEEAPLGNQAGACVDSPAEGSSMPSLLGTSVENLSNDQRMCHTTNQEWENRIYSCVVVSPAGRVISEFESIKELLESMRDAIRAHQSLYVDGNILHCDISPNNIIITNSDTADGFKGMLIDFDLAKLLDSGATGVRPRTGTVRFMAIEVLRRKGNTYRHDLESFFYVLLWMCARTSWTKAEFQGGKNNGPVKVSKLERWVKGNFEDIADRKQYLMGLNGFQDILDEFPKAFKVVQPLCDSIRLLLFPLDERGNMFLGTPTKPPDELYSSILAAFDDTIGKLP